ncbi:MAG TPA: outer membrane protein transport protein [Kofleriaceae bacterium]|nr:outer membrane protein transport protein [Kofleriaceae bacterium]
MHTLRTSLFAALSGGLGLCALAGTASANGFFINEHDAKSTGRAGANAASNGDASSIIFSPGGIALGEGTDIALTASMIAAKGSYFDASNMDARTDTDGDPAVLPSFFARSRINDMFAVGVGFHLPFGLAVSWPDNHAQSDVIQDQSLRTYFITPSVGLNLDKMVPGLSIGGGIDLVPSTVQLEQAVIFGETRGTAVLGGSAFGIGGRAGVQYRPAVLPQLRIGAMWRSQVNLSYEGKGDFDIDPAFRSQLPPDGDIATSIRLPQMFAGGIAYSPVPALQLEVNANWINWSKFDELRIELPGDAVTVSPQNYKDTVTLRVGAEYAIGKRAAVRAGYIYDPTPIPNTTVSARLPDADRHDLTAGGSYSIGNMDVHLGLLWVLPASQETSDAEYMPQFKGKYEVTAFVASLSLAGKFGK